MFATADLLEARTKLRLRQILGGPATNCCWRDARRCRDFHNFMIPSRNRMMFDRGGQSVFRAGSAAANLRDPCDGNRAQPPRITTPRLIRLLETLCNLNDFSFLHSLNYQTSQFPLVSIKMLPSDIR